MRSILGFILGVVATIAVAYFHDTAAASPGAKIVNWDQAAEFGRAMIDVVRQQFDRLIGN